MHCSPKFEIFSIIVTVSNGIFLKEKIARFLFKLGKLFKKHMLEIFTTQAQ